jgi:hypothetical protein
MAPCTLLPIGLIRLFELPVARATLAVGSRISFAREKKFVSVLWSPPGKRFFAGRKAWGNQDFAYLSQFRSPDTRAHFMATKLCDRIGGPGASEEWGAPPRPKWMRWKTYERLSRKCEDYFGKASVIPREHRLNGDVV